MRERAEIFSLQLSPRLNKRSRSGAPAGGRSGATPSAEVVCIAPDDPCPAKLRRAKKGFMLSEHNEPVARSLCAQAKPVAMSKPPGTRSASTDNLPQRISPC